MHEGQPVAAAKAALRQEVLRRRRALPLADRLAASARIVASLDDLPELVAARAVLGYAAFGSEVTIDEWLARRAARGDGVFLPYVDGERLGIARIRDLDADTAPGFRGIREPKAIGRSPALLDRLEAVVVPGVAFDRSGRRIGYGAGFYDRLLAELPAGIPAIGVAFEVQVVDLVPATRHDRRVDAVVTDRAVYR